MPSIEFRMDVSGIPHAYVVMNNGAGVTRMYGFAPAATGILGIGKIYDESVTGIMGYPWDITTGSINVAAEQYKKAVPDDLAVGKILRSAIGSQSEHLYL